MPKIAFDYYSMIPPEAGWVITAKVGDKVPAQWYELDGTYDAEQVEEIVGLLNLVGKEQEES